MKPNSITMSDLTETINLLPVTSDYYFIRTDGGENFQSFIENSYVAIGWNEISVRDLSKNKTDVKQKIANIYQLDLKVTKDKRAATDIYNKIIHFSKLKIDDVIIVPSENSEYLAFGTILDDGIFEKDNGEFDCNYFKRRKVNWVLTKNFSELDDIFYKIRQPRRAIFNVTKYSDSIDSVMYDVYTKAEFSHFVVRVSSEEDVNWLGLGNALVRMHKMLEVINKEFALQEDVNSASIKIAIQSPGLFNLKHAGLGLILLATILGSSSCKDVKANLTEEQKQMYNNIEQNNIDTLEFLKSDLHTAGIQL